MIFSISKVRPAGHDHVYKYAHAQTVDDVKTVSWDYKGDGNSDKEWNYEMQNLSSGNYFLRGIYYAEKIDKEFPSLTTIRQFYGNSPSLMDVKLSFPNVITASWGLADYAGVNPIERTMEIKLPKAKDLSGLFYENEIPYNGLKLYCPEATNITNIVEWGWQRNRYDALNAEYPKVEYASGYWWKAVNEIKHDIDEDGNFSFATGKPTVGKAYTTFPSLKDAQNFGEHQELYSDYAKAFLTDLPDWTGNSENHRLRLGLSIDGKYDPELQSKLYEADETYTPTINLSGGPTSHKNWKITVDWNGTSDGDASPPSQLAEMTFCENSIPDAYTPCKYLQSDGSQYIKTNYIPTDTTGAFIDLYQESGIALGCNNHWANWNGPNIFGLNVADTPQVRWKSYTNLKNSKSIPLLNKRYTCRLNYKNDRVLYYDFGDNKWFKENLEKFDNANTTYDITFFAFNSANTISKMVGKVFRTQITEGEEVVRDFVPCLDAEGTPCMRDLINGVDYYNSGSGQFTYELA